MVADSSGHILRVLVKALFGRMWVSRSIRTIIVIHVIFSHIFIFCFLGRVQFPKFLWIPPILRRITSLNASVLIITSWAATDVKSLKMSFEWCMSPINLCSASICCPAFSIPQACFYLHWLWWIAYSNIFKVLEHSNGNIVYVKSVTKQQ